MNIKQVGHGTCPKCATPMMGGANGPVCFGCMADAEPKTGRTVVVTEVDGTEAVSLEEVGQIAKSLRPLSPKVENDGRIHLSVSADDLEAIGIVQCLLYAAFAAMDNMPPAGTMREMKRMIKIQESIEALIKKQEKKLNA